MKILKTKEFLAMPPGTVFVKIQGPHVAEISVKCKNLSETDTSYSSTEGKWCDAVTLRIRPINIKRGDGNPPFYQLEAGSECQVGFIQNGDRFASFEEDLFGVFDEEEKAKIIERLSLTLSLFGPQQTKTPIQDDGYSPILGCLHSVDENVISFVVFKKKNGWFINGTEYGDTPIHLSDLDPNSLHNLVKKKSMLYQGNESLLSEFSEALQNAISKTSTTQ